MEADNLFPKEGVEFSYDRTPYLYTQFVHRSGVAFVQIRECNQGFYWVYNRLLLTSTGMSGSLRGGLSVGSSVPNPESIREKLINMCQDREQLQVFWDECIQKLVNSYTSSE